MFKLFLTSIFLGLIYIGNSDANSGNKLIDGTLIEAYPIQQLSRRSSRTRSHIQLECPPGTTGNACADDCKTLLACSPGNRIPIITNLCSDLSNDLPYCTPGKSGCSANGDRNNPLCTSANSTFQCTNEGYFPDPVDCSKYYLCTEAITYSYVCPSNYIYDAGNSKCKKPHSSRECTTLAISCEGVSNRYVAYPGHTAYYAFCDRKQSRLKIIMFRCGSSNYEFNPLTLNCEFICKEHGLFPDTNDCKNYYECYGNGRNLKSRLQSCPAGQVFDEYENMCIRGTCKFLQRRTIIKKCNKTP